MTKIAVAPYCTGELSITGCIVSSENSSFLSSQNMSSIVAVAFILSLLSLALNFYNYQRTNETIRGFARIDLQAAQREADINKQLAGVQDVSKNLDALRARVDALEAAGAAQAAAAAPAK